MRCSPLPCLPRRSGTKETPTGTVPQSGGGQKRSTTTSNGGGSHRISSQKHVAFADSQNDDPDFHDARSENSQEGVLSRASSDRSLHYFDALEDYDNVAAYPHWTTAEAPAHKPRVTIDEPETLLRPSEQIRVAAAASAGAVSPLSSTQDDSSDGEEKKEELGLVDDGSDRTKTGETLASHAKQIRSGKFRRARRSTRVLLKELDGRSSVTEKGFPGQLTRHEVDMVQKFRRELDERDPIYGEIVHGFHEIEEEAYALCRYLRARKFDPEKVFELLDQGKELWREASKRDFYPDIDEALGVPISLFQSQYPFVYYGNAKNGCPTCYFTCGQVQPEGIKCLTNFEGISGYFWHEFMYTFQQHLKTGREENPDFVRSECVQVYNLKGLSRAQVNNDSINVIRIGNEITTCFPETLHCLIIINAPAFFSFAWSLIKKFVDPRTASKIEVYSNAAQGKKRILELVDEKEVPADYGGKAPTTESIIRSGSGHILSGSSAHGTSPTTDGSLWTINHLFHIKKNKEAKFEFELKDGETATLIRVYTRSAFGGKFEVKDASTGKTIAESNVEPPEGHAEASSEASSAASGELETPYGVDIASSSSTELSGPGKFRVEGRNLSKGHGGHFLLAGKVKSSPSL